jgi:hypothetical protein
VEAPSTDQELWLAIGTEVNPNRPLFTGDVFPDIVVAGQDDLGPAMIVAHPCSMRGKNGAIMDRVLMAPIRPYQKVPLEKWPRGHFGVFPIPGIDASAAVHLDLLGTVRSAGLEPFTRTACMSERGVNLLQQRLVMRLTRVDIPTRTFHEAFSHTYEEADLLEEWSDIVTEKGVSVSDAAARFEELIRAPRQPLTLQAALRDPQERAAVRREVRRAAEAFD